MTRAIEHLAVDRAVEPGGETSRLDAGELVGEFTENWVHLRGVARALGLQLPAELALGLGPRDDRVDLRLRSTDDGVRRGRVDADLEVGVVDEDVVDVLGAVLDQRHQADVVALQHRLALAHQPRTLADDACRVLQRQAAADVRRRGLTHRMRHQHTGFRAMVAQGVGKCDLNGVDADLAGLDAVGLLVVEEHLGDRVTQLVLDERVDAVDVLREDRILGVELLGHLAVLRTEARQQPHGRRRIRRIRRVHKGIALAVGDRADAGDGVLMGAGHHHGTRTAVVAVCERASDVGERGGPALVGFEPLQQVGGGLAATRRQEAGDHQRDDRTLDGTRRETLGRVGRGLGDHRLDILGLRGQDGPLGLGQELVLVVEIRFAGQRSGGGELRRPGVDRDRLRLQVARQDLADHHVGVGAAEAEAGDAGDGVARVAGPLGGLRDDLQVGRVELDVRVGAAVVARRRDDAVLQREDDLGDRTRTRSGFHVSVVGLHRTEQHRLVGGAAAPDDAPEGVGLDRVAEDGAGAMGLDVVDGARVDRRVGVRRTQHLDLGLGVRGGQTVGTTVGVDGRARDDREDVVAVAAGVGHALEDDETTAFGADHAVGVGGEGLDVAVLGLRADPVEAEGRGGGDQHVDAAGEGDVGFAGAEAADRLVNRHQ